MQDILDIKGPLAPPPLWWPWILAALLLLLAGLLAWWLWRRRRPRPLPPPPAPHETALRALEALGQESGLADREFYYRLSALLRGYLEARFRLPALEMTTEELLPRLEALTIPAGARQETARLLRRADPVKYAGFKASTAIRGQDLETARALVLATQPQQEQAGNA
jgi:hypothetical protein